MFLVLVVVGKYFFSLEIEDLFRFGFVQYFIGLKFALCLLNLKQSRFDLYNFNFFLDGVYDVLASLEI